MLKATFYSAYYSKGGNKMYRYSVTGPKVEIEEYLIIQTMATNKDINKWPVDDKGNPLFFLNVTQLDARGGTATKSFNLLKAYQDKGYNADTFAQEILESEEEKELVRQARATIKAELQMGIRKIARRTTAAKPTDDTTPVNKPAGNPEVKDDILEQAMASMTPEGAGGETLGE